jgi:hypothetical protein
MFFAGGRVRPGTAISLAPDRSITGERRRPISADRGDNLQLRKTARWPADE